MNPGIAQDQVPVTVIGGFLGSGKTTLLNRVLHEASGIRYAVMVNDFGELAIDEMLIRDHDGETISFANGCVCCSLGDNLVDSIDRLLARDPAPEQFLIEVSGVANPKVIADVATLHPKLRRDLVISLVDASSVERRLRDERMAGTFKMQLAPADLLLLNKVDLVDQSRIHDVINNVTTRLRALSSAPIVSTAHARLPKAVLSAQGIDTGGPDSARPSVRESTPKHSVGDKRNEPSLNNTDHNPSQQFWRAKLTPDPALSASEIKAILLQHQHSLVRAKGFLTSLDKLNDWTEIQFSGSVVDLQPARHKRNSSDQSVLVLIGIEPLDKLVDALCNAFGRNAPKCHAMQTPD